MTMPYHHRQNLYPGVNAHLQTRLPMRGSPSPSAWPSFHGEHLGKILDALNDALPPHYIARTEQSLQIRTFDFVLGPEKPQKPQPDVSIYRLGGTATPLDSSGSGGIALMTSPPPVLDMLMDISLLDRFLASVVILEVAQHELHGEVVARIELLSPSNKAGGSGYEGYLVNRTRALQAGSTLIELDYFHETPSPALSLMEAAYYPSPGAYPYSVTLNRPQGHKIHVQYFGLGVADSLPTQFVIPLLRDESVALDLKAAYQETFVRGRWGDYIDYAQPIAASDLATFRADDQAALEALRQQIIHTHFGG